MLAFGSSGSGDGCGGKGSWDDIRPDIAWTIHHEGVGIQFRGFVNGSIHCLQ